MKKVISIFFSLFLMATPITLFANANSADNANSKISNNQSQVLAVLLAENATIQKNKHSNRYQLVLTKANNDVIYFTERPNRVSGQVPLSQFLKQWTKGSFKTDAPNAVIQLVKQDTKTNKLARESSAYEVTLVNPTYTASHKNKLTFDIKPLPGNKNTLPLNVSSHYVAVFIDSVCLSCIGY